MMNDYTKTRRCVPTATSHAAPSPTPRHRAARSDRSPPAQLLSAQCHLLLPPPSPGAPASGHGDLQELKHVRKRGTGLLQTPHKQGSCCRPPAAVPLPQKSHIESSQLPGPGPPPPCHRGYSRPVSPEGLSWAPSSSPGKHRPRLEEDWGKWTIAPWPGGLAPDHQALLMGASGPNMLGPAARLPVCRPPPPRPRS